MKIQQRQDIVLGMLKSRGRATAMELADVLCWDEQLVRDALQKLRKKAKANRDLTKRLRPFTIRTSRGVCASERNQTVAIWRAL